MYGNYKGTIMLANLKFDIDELNKNDNGLIYEPVDGFNGHICSVDTQHPTWVPSYPNGCNDEGKRYDPITFIIEQRPGIWECSSGNFHIDLIDIDIEVDPYPYITTYGNYLSRQQYMELLNLDTRPDIISEYGICDDIDQLVSYARPCIDNTEYTYVIAMMPVLKCAQPEFGGWRWEKWGTYIGCQNPQADYLIDEPEIDTVYCFHIYAVKTK